MCALLAVILGCAGTAEEAGTQSAENDRPAAMDQTSDDGEEVSWMQGFSWVVEGELAAMPLPGRKRTLTEDVTFLRGQGIRQLVSLTEETPSAEALAVAAIGQVHIPVRDFTAPTLEQMVEFVDVVSKSVERGESVGVHCTAGLGRSGTMAAAYLVSRGESAAEAINTVRRLRPGSIETEEQVAAVSLFEGHWIAMGR